MNYSSLSYWARTLGKTWRLSLILTILSIVGSHVLAQTKVTIASASTTSSYGATYTAAKVIDGITNQTNNGWYSSSDGSDTNPKLTLDLGSAQSLITYRIYHENDSGYNPMLSHFKSLNIN